MNCRNIRYRRNELSDFFRNFRNSFKKEASTTEERLGSSTRRRVFLTDTAQEERADRREAWVPFLVLRRPDRREETPRVTAKRRVLLFFALHDRERSHDIVERVDALRPRIRRTRSLYKKRRLTSTQRNAKEGSAPRKDENVATPSFPKGRFARLAASLF